MKTKSKIFVATLMALIAITFACTRPQPEDLIIGTWKVDTIFTTNVDTSLVDPMRLQQVLEMQKQVYFVINENGQMDLISPFGAKTANWEMNNDSLILTATFIDNNQVSKIKFDEITKEKLVLKEESQTGTFITEYRKQ